MRMYCDLKFMHARNGLYRNAEGQGLFQHPQ